MSRATEADSIAEFWRWWTTTGGATVASAIEGKRPAAIAGEVSAQVHALHPDLAWETAAGDLTRHLLVVTAAGDGAVRALARRWLLAAPASDDTWSYADLRQPLLDPGTGSLVVAGEDIDFARTVVGARAVGNHLDVTVQHPAFAALGEDDRLQAAYLVLDAVAGEEAVECWLGEIAASTIAPLDAFPVQHLGVFVRTFARERQDDEGNPQWVLLRGTGPAGPVMALALSTLSCVIAPLFDTHVAIDLPYAGRTAEELPDPLALESLRTIEDRLVDRLGAAGLLVAAETRAGVRRLHFYVETDGAGAGLLAAQADSWGDGTADVTVTADPGWGEVAHLRS